MARDIFDDDNAVIDQQAQRQDESCNDQLAEIISGGIYSEQARCEGQRDRHHHNRCCAPAKRQQGYHDQRQRQCKIARQFLQAFGDVAALIKLRDQLDIRGQIGFLDFDFVHQNIAQFRRVGADLLVGGNPDGAFAIMIEM